MKRECIKSAQGQTRRSFEMKFLTLFIVALAALCSLSARGEKLQVYLIPHSHCDPGWLETFDAYFDRQVNSILDNVFKVLSAQPEKRFVWAEISFFMKWFGSLPAERREEVRRIIQSGQLEFVGGGWVQNDEANPWYTSVIDQVMEGHEYVYALFGVRPRIAWQIDPFGHSAATASLFARMGYEAVVINRIHHSTKRKFKQTKHLEFMWDTAPEGEHSFQQPSASPDSILTHVLHTHYSAIKGFDFENYDAPSISTHNVAQRAQAFVKQIQVRASAYRTRHIMVPFGDDFKFQRASKQFENMDRVIAYINEHMSDVEIHYSTVSTYFDALRAELTQADVKLPVYTGDFFPYADNEESYWTGYYTSRPTLKAECREVKSLVHMADALFAFAKAQGVVPAQVASEAYNKLESSRLALALVLHHDAITGTARKHVVADYSSRLSIAADFARGVSATMLGLLYATGTAAPDSNALALKAPSLEAKAVDSVTVAVYNPTAWERVEVVEATLQVAAGNQLPAVTVSAGESDEAVPSQVYVSGAEVLVAFEAKVPGFGSTAFHISVDSSSESESGGVAERVTAYVLSSAAAPQLRGQSVMHPRKREVKRASVASILPELPSGWMAPDGTISLCTTCMCANVSVESGLLQSLQLQSATGVQSMQTEQMYHMYKTRQSGAYIFRPLNAGERVQPTTFSEASAALTLIKGKLLQRLEVRTQAYTHVYTVYNPSEAACLEHDSQARYLHFQPSVTAGNNEERVVRFATSSQGRFLADNGYRLLHRPLRSSSAPSEIRKHYVPMNSVSALTAVATDAVSTAIKSGTAVGRGDPRVAQLSVHTRQPIGVTAFKDNAEDVGITLEMMLHRKLMQDDGRGLAQSVADTSVSAPLLLLSLDDAATSLRQWRATSIKHHNPLRLFYTAAGVSKQKWLASSAPLIRPLAMAVPRSVNIPTLKVRDDATDDIILRLESIHTHTRAANTDDSTKVPLQLFAPNARAQGVHVENVRMQALSVVYPLQRLLEVPLVAASTDAALTHTSGAAAEEEERQNTKEAGVFISDAALKKMREDAERKRKQNGLRGAPQHNRRLLSAAEALMSVVDHNLRTRRRLLSTNESFAVPTAARTAFAPIHSSDLHTYLIEARAMAGTRPADGESTQQRLGDVGTVARTTGHTTGRPDSSSDPNTDSSPGEAVSGKEGEGNESKGIEGSIDHTQQTRTDTHTNAVEEERSQRREETNWDTTHNQNGRREPQGMDHTSADSLTPDVQVERHTQSEGDNTNSRGQRTSNTVTTAKEGAESTSKRSAATEKSSDTKTSGTLSSISSAFKRFRTRLQQPRGNTAAHASAQTNSALGVYVMMLPIVFTIGACAVCMWRFGVWKKIAEMIDPSRASTRGSSEIKYL